MYDLLKRLRSADFIHDRFVNPDGPEAADEIERLREEIKECADANAKLIKAIKDLQQKDSD